ncbi:MAG TPA: hypothetical protein VHB79_09280 [Polyangiaceae bacterium]|nr:hypothetical protein [Polyangiaceae bacterium]
MTRVTSLSLISLCLAACAQMDPPRELKLELPALITSKEPVIVHARAVQQDGTTREPSGNLDYKVTPPDLASIGKGGVFACNHSGDGSVALTLAGVEGRAKFSCKLIARLDVPAKLTLDAAAGEQDLPVKVLDSSGRELDVPVSVTSDRASVVQARSGRVVPDSVGNAKLSVRAGELAKPVEVEVVRTLKPEVLPVDQNRRISYSLEAGKYRLSIQLPAAHQVTVDWLGAPYCAYRRTAAEHQAECTLQHKGSVSFDNPAFLLRGEKTPSVEGVTLREVP